MLKANYKYKNYEKYALPSRNAFTMFIIDANANTNSINTAVLETKVTYSSALQKNKEVVINWKTATEQDDAQFTIEKSTDGIHFNVVTTENATSTNAGEHEYFTFDFLPSRGTSFYRLSQKMYLER